MTAIDWAKHLKVLVLCSFFAAFGNWLYTKKAGAAVTPLEAVPGLLLILLITVIGLLIWDLINRALGEKKSKNLPAIAYISLIAIIMTIPGFPGASFTSASIGKIQLLPLCTPILAYAGISLGKDLHTFKEQGIKIILVSLFAFIGTFIGSAIIAQIVLKLTGVI